MTERREMVKMSEFTIQLAGRTVAVQTMYDTTRALCAEYLCEGAPCFTVTANQRDIEQERVRAAREDEVEGLPPRQFSDGYLETTAIQRKITEKFFEYDILLFHGSVIAVDGEAYLFTAKSGTGKSTHTRLWREQFGDRAVMVNDDKPFLKFEGDRVIACGSPWNGKHRLGSNIMVPLKAVCILERGEENQIAQIDPKDALQMLFQQSSRPQNPRLMPKYMELIDRLAQNVSLYHLNCNMDPEAAKVSYEGMSGNRYDEITNRKLK